MIEAACRRLGVERLRPLKDALPKEVTFDEIRLVISSMRLRGREALTNADNQKSAAAH